MGRNGKGGKRGRESRGREVRGGKDKGRKGEGNGEVLRHGCWGDGRPCFGYQRFESLDNIIFVANLSRVSN